jgi:hypothetical protein
MADEKKKLKKGDKALGAAGAGHVDMMWYRLIGMDQTYVYSFKFAGDRLVATQDFYRESVVIAIGYLYRHYLELHLKYLLIEARTAGVATITDDELQQEHGLHQLWNKARVVIENDGAPADPTTMAAAEAIIQEIHTVDPSGQEFRYSRTKAGKESLERMPSKFSLQQLAEAIEKCHDFLQEHTLVFTCMSDPNA